MYYYHIRMKNVSYATLQKKYPGKLVAVSQKEGKVIASSYTSQQLERALKNKKVDPATCLFLGPIERYKQISAY